MSLAGQLVSGSAFVCAGVTAITQLLEWLLSANSKRRLQDLAEGTWLWLSEHNSVNLIRTLRNRRLLTWAPAATSLFLTSAPVGYCLIYRDSFDNVLATEDNTYILMVLVLLIFLAYTVLVAGALTVLFRVFARRLGAWLLNRGTTFSLIARLTLVAAASSSLIAAAARLAWASNYALGPPSRRCTDTSPCNDLWRSCIHIMCVESDLADGQRDSQHVDVPGAAYSRAPARPNSRPQCAIRSARSSG
jgi:hypothetical protein